MQDLLTLTRWFITQFKDWGLWLAGALVFLVMAGVASPYIKRLYDNLSHHVCYNCLLWGTLAVLVTYVIYAQDSIMTVLGFSFALLCGAIAFSVLLCGYWFKR